MIKKAISCELVYYRLSSKPPIDWRTAILFAEAAVETEPDIKGELVTVRFNLAWFLPERWLKELTDVLAAHEIEIYSVRQVKLR